MCWVFDTNTLISRLLSPGGVPAKAVDHALASGVLLVSKDTIELSGNKICSLIIQ
jgi:predicted nucleic acid-binding protein